MLEITEQTSGYSLCAKSPPFVRKLNGRGSMSSSEPRLNPSASNLAFPMPARHTHALLPANHPVQPARRDESDNDSPHEIDVSALVRAALRGDREALAQLHKHFGPLVHAVLLARVPFHDAHDLTQDVFMLAMQKLHTLRDPQSIGPWLMTLARRAAADFHRRRPNQLQLTSDSQARDTSWDSLDNPGRASAALQAIRSLPEANQDTLILRLVEGLTGPQIAACTGMTHGSVRVNLHHGMRLLREKLGAKEDAS